ncbi:lipoyl(octanoyl) transferase LipB [Desulfosediminicola flagellatus]|uniref:lipoyl(octanoyl) transferase LipB n=1 Tax=Desulfosediminicola flagellatus TaxID=2569541 RepID=UPI0010AD3D50|nr:lipoyl(octanoyl) transferase LipB [Desulfosediminicola flagellatus]
MDASICNLGLMEYQVAYDLQTRLVDERRTLESGNDIFLIVEHPSVYTLGRRGGREFLMVSEEFLAEKEIAIVPIERGGVITYHGPGQLVIYPIVHLKQAKMSVAEYVSKLEELMIRLAADVGVIAGRDERNHGVWVGNNKMGSIGIAIRHGVSFHGLALNVNLSLDPFGWINPCGLTGVQMTSLSVAAGEEITMERVLKNLIKHLEDVFPYTFTEISRDQLPA